jgi:hypothetical protein
MFNNKQYKFNTTNSAYLVLNGLEATNQVTFGFAKEASTDKIHYSPRNVYIAFGPIFQENRPMLVLTQEQLNKLKEFINYVYELDMLPDPYCHEPE